MHSVDALWERHSYYCRVSPEHPLLESLKGNVPIFFCPLPKLSSRFPATQNALFLSLFLSLIRNTRKTELDSKGKGNLDDTGLMIPVYRETQVISYLVDRTFTANPLNKSPFPGQCGAGLSVPAARHSAPAGPSGTTAAPCVPRLARRGGTSPGQGDPAAPPSSPTLPRETAVPPKRDRLCVCRSVGHLSAPGSARRAHLQPPPPTPGKRDRGAAVVRRLAPQKTAELLGHRSRDATKNPAPAPCPEPPPSSPIPERSPLSLAACEAPCKGGARRRYRARVGSGAGGRRGVLFGDGEGGERQQPELPLATGSPQLGTLDTLAACCQPQSPGASPAPVEWMGLQK